MATACYNSLKMDASARDDQADLFDGHIGLGT